MPEDFRSLVAAVTAEIAGRPFDADLDTWLNARHGAASPTYARSRRPAWRASRKAGCARAKPAESATAASRSPRPPSTGSPSTSSTWTTWRDRTMRIRKARSTS